MRLVDERIDSIVDRSAAAGRQGQPVVVDMYDEARTLVQKMAIRTLFGAELAERSSEIAALFRRAQDYLESPALRQLPHPFPVGRRGRVRSDLAALRAIVTERLEQVRSSGPGDGSDVLAVMATEGELSDDEIVDQALTLLGAGSRHHVGDARLDAVALHARRACPLAAIARRGRRRPHR